MQLAITMRPVTLLKASRRLAQPTARHFRSVAPALRVRAAAEGGEEEGQSQLLRREPSSSVAPWGAGDLGWGLGPSTRVGSLFREMENEFNQLSRAFGMPAMFDLPTVAAPPAGARLLAVDIQDKGDHLEISADVPGLRRADIKIQVSPDRILSISGERKTEKREGSEEEGVLRVERSYGTFLRRFRLPDNVDPEGIKAQTKEGVLRLTVPKTEQAQPKQIDIDVAE